MTDIFNRKYSLKIGRNRKLIESIFGPKQDDYFLKRNSPTKTGKVYNEYQPGLSLISQEYVDWLTVPNSTIEFTDHHIEADVEDNKNTISTSSSQECSIKIYNASQEDIDFMRGGDSVILRAGYEKDADNLPVIYVGQIDYIVTTRSGPDLITEIFSTPGKMTNDILVTRSYPPGTRLIQVIRDLVSIAATKGIPTGRIIGEDIDIFSREYYFGYTVRGNLLDVLGKVCDENHLKYYIVAGKIYVESKDRDSYIKVITLTEDQIKGYVNVEQDKSTTATTTAVEPQDINMKLFLNGDISTNTLVRFQPTSTYLQQFGGDYFIQSVKHTLSFEGDVWDTEISCTKRSLGGAS